MDQIKNPSLPKTIVQADMRKINRSAILEFLRLSGPVSRSEISDQLGLSRPSVKRIIDRLIEKGFVIPVGKSIEGKGRARELLSLNQTNNTIIGIDIGGGHISGALVTIGGEILIEAHQPEKWGDAEENFNHIQSFIKNLIEKARTTEHRLLGVGVGVPGIIEPTSGTVTIAPSLSWSNFPFLEKIHPRFDVPIYIENDVALATLGEYWFGSGVGKRNLVLIAIGTGIGAGIIIEGNLYRGHTNAAGEIGYFLPGREYLNNQYPGFGALEQLASGKGIADRAREMLPESNAPLAEIDDTAAIIEAARMKKPWAQTLIEETIDYYSQMVANISLCFDPEVIIIGGGLAASFDFLFEPITNRLSGVIPSVPPLQPAALENNAPILGAVTHVFQKVTDYAFIHIS